MTTTAATMNTEEAEAAEEEEEEAAAARGTAASVLSPNSFVAAAPLAFPNKALSKRCGVRH